jgi:iron complex outermembrane receptor protein
VLIAMLLQAAAGAAGEAPVREPAAQEPAARAREERVVVTARRLDDGSPGAGLPPNATVYTREEIEASGARTVQEFLAGRAPFVVYDQVGNGLEAEVDLRGFSEGTAVAVFLDGVRLNSPDDNRTDLEAVLLEEVERIEVWRGPGSTLYGPGAGAGVVRIETRAGAGTSAEAGMRAGSFDARAARVAGSWGERWRVSFGAGWDESDGFRENGAYEATRARARVEREVAGGVLRLSAHHASLDARQPGSLKAQEWDLSAWDSPYNRTDRHETDRDLLSARWEGAPGEGSPWRVALQAAGRRDEDETLTTGRYAAGRRGFVTDASTREASLAAQAARGGERTELVLGIEAGASRLEAGAWESGPDGSERLLTSDTTTRRREAALFARAAWRPAPRWRVEAGVRLDEVRLRLEGSAASVGNGMEPLSGERRFRVATPRLRASRDAGSGAWTLLLSEGWLLPTPTDLYAFPGFGSNPDLDETRVRSLETGWSGGLPAGGRLSVNLYRMEVRDEVLFLADRPPFGRNENVPRTRRQGVELAWAQPLPHRLRLDLEYARTEATFRSSFEASSGPVEPGDRIPLVPHDRVSLRLGGPAGSALRWRLAGSWTGERPLANDEGNHAPDLPSHLVVNAGLDWEPARVEGLRVSLRAANLLDESYATRGIARVPDELGVAHDFYTPAPGRSVELGVRWSWNGRR